MRVTTEPGLPTELARLIAESPPERLPAVLAALRVRAVEIPQGEIPGLLVGVSALLAAVAARSRVPQRRGDRSSMAPERSGLLTVPEVAQRLAVPRSYVYELARRGELPCVRFGKYVRICPSVLRKWLESRTAEVDTRAIRSV